LAAGFAALALLTCAISFESTFAAPEYCSIASSWSGFNVAKNAAAARAIRRGGRGAMTRRNRGTTTNTRANLRNRLHTAKRREVLIPDRHKLKGEDHHRSGGWT
jgi:hypothetical protein